MSETKTFNQSALTIKAQIVVPVDKVLEGTVIAGYTGTMPNRAGDTPALASSISGTTLKLRASAGYRDGVDDNVTITDPDFNSSNIVAGKEIFGLTGTAPTGKRYASGEMNYVGYNDGSYWRYYHYTLDLSILNFTPSFYEVYAINDETISIYSTTLYDVARDIRFCSGSGKSNVPGITNEDNIYTSNGVLHYISHYAKDPSSGGKVIFHAYE